MTHCEYCGQQIQAGEAYCPHCGGPIPKEAQQAAQAAQTAQQSTASTGTASAGQIPDNVGDHTLILVSRGDCSASEAKSVLKSILGYTTAQTKELLDSLPAAAAHNLTYQQATYAAQALSEHGMEVSICNSNGYITFDSEQNSSIFGKDGSLLEVAAAVLATLTGLHKLTSFHKWTRPDYSSHLFRPYGGGRRPDSFWGRRPPHPPPMPHDHYPYGGRPPHMYGNGHPGGNMGGPEREDGKDQHFIPGFGPGPSRAQRPGRTTVTLKPLSDRDRKRRK